MDDAGEHWLLPVRNSYRWLHNLFDRRSGVAFWNSQKALAGACAAAIPSVVGICTKLSASRSAAISLRGKHLRAADQTRPSSGSTIDLVVPQA